MYHLFLIIIKFHKSICSSPLSCPFEPQNYNEVAQIPKWHNVMKKYINALERNNIWIIIDLPHGNKIIGCKWVYKVKYKVDGSIKRYNTFISKRLQST